MQSTYYRDKFIELKENELIISSFIIPKFSNITYELDEIQSVSCIKLNLFQKCRLLGSHDFKIWWTWDVKRPFKNYAFLVRHNRDNFQIGFTVENFEKAYHMFEEHLNEKFIDKRNIS